MREAVVADGVAPNGAADPSVGPLERGLAVLRVLAHAPGGRLRPSELARATGLTRPPVDRITSTLSRLGHVREEGREVVLAPPLLSLGAAYLRGSGLTEVCSAPAEALADLLDESVSVAVPDREMVRFVVQHTRRRALSLAFRIGEALPAERCAPGVLFASEWTEAEWDSWRDRTPKDFPVLPPVPSRRPDESALRAAAARAAERGWALDDQLIEPGLVAVSVPVRGRDGRIVAALSAVSHTSRRGAEDLRALALGRLRAAAGTMTQGMAALGPATAASPVPDLSVEAKRALGPGYLQALARGLNVLSALGGEPGGRTPADVARSTGLPRATVRRAILTLENLGYVRGEGENFVLLPQVLDLGYAALSRLRLGDIAQPHLSALVGQVQESASVAVLDGPDIRCAGRVAANRIMSVDITVGTRFPAHATSTGRVLLAGLPPGERAAWLDAAASHRTAAPFAADGPQRFGEVLDQVRADGYAMIENELEEGVRSVAVPVHDRDGRVVAAVNVAQRAGRVGAEQTRDRFLPALRETADRIASDMALVPQPSR